MTLFTSMSERADINCALVAGTGVPELRTNQPSSLDKDCYLIWRLA